MCIWDNDKISRIDSIIWIELIIKQYGLTLSTTTTSTEPLRIRVSTRLRACSPVSGWDSSKFSVLTPIISAREGSKACSASIKAQYPTDRNKLVKDPKKRHQAPREEALQVTKQKALD